MPELAIEDGAWVLQVLGHRGVEEGKDVLTERDCHFDLSDAPAHVMGLPGKGVSSRLSADAPPELFFVLSISRPA